MITTKTALMLAVTATLALSACDKLPTGSNGAAATATSGSGDQAAKAKLSAYTEGYNKLLDTFGLPETRKTYLEADIASQSPSDSINVTDGWLDQGVSALRTARALPGGAADVDAAADRLIGALDTVIKRLGGLKVYYDSKAYRDDGLRRGKSEDAAMRAEFTAATAALDAFDVVLDRERRVATAAELTALKAAGDMLGYNTKLALQQAEGVINLFGKEEDLRDAAVFARGDGQIAALEKTLADMRVELAKAPKSDPVANAAAVSYGIVGDQLTSAVGDYRDLKQSRDADDYNDMIKNYNRAIDTSNNINS